MTVQEFVESELQRLLKFAAYWEAQPVTHFPRHMGRPEWEEQFEIWSEDAEE